MGSVENYTRSDEIRHVTLQYEKDKQLEYTVVTKIQERFSILYAALSEDSADWVLHWESTDNKGDEQPSCDISELNGAFTFHYFPFAALFDVKECEPDFLIEQGKRKGLISIYCERRWFMENQS